MSSPDKVHEFIASKSVSNAYDADSYEPVFFKLTRTEDLDKLKILIEEKSILYVCDEIEQQLHELIKLRNPAVKIQDEEYKSRIDNHLSGTAKLDYGVWVYYPWKKTLVHILDEKEFIEVRTNRNKNKITLEEQNNLAKKVIGIIGLSVGNAIATTVAMERICGTIRLADFDTIELSNLNRIKTGLTNLSIAKVIVAAREIAEIDPFLKVEVFNTGISKSNIVDFLMADDKKIDVLVEVCDNLEVKLLARYHARKQMIPVVMDTSDRGMLDVERYDLEEELPIFHGKIDEAKIDFDDLTLDDVHRFEVLKSIVDYDKLSARMKQSMAEIGKSISTWPQLASSVVLGGGATTDLCRKILLHQHKSSNRYYVDLDDIFTA